MMVAEAVRFEIYLETGLANGLDVESGGQRGLPCSWPEQPHRRCFPEMRKTREGTINGEKFQLLWGHSCRPVGNCTVTTSASFYLEAKMKQELLLRLENPQLYLAQK